MPMRCVIFTAHVSNASNVKNSLGFPFNSQISFAAIFEPLSRPAFWLLQGQLLSFQLRSFRSD